MGYTHQGFVDKDETKPLTAKQLIKMEDAIIESQNEINSIKAIAEVSTAGRALYLEGASFADYSIGFQEEAVKSKGNGWFELACERLGLEPINKARSGSSIVDFARGLSGNADANGNTVYEPWTDEEFEKFDVLCIMHVHNQNVADESVLKETYDGTEDFLNRELKSTSKVGYVCKNLTPSDYALAYDYVFKKYSELCYAKRLDPNSRWYGTKMGKPVKIVLCTHWHDGRETFNNAIRTLSKKWGAKLCEFDKLIGFTKNQVNPATGEQWSVLYCNNANGDTEVIDGVTYGWHQTRGKDAYIQKHMANIFASEIKPVLSDPDFIEYPTVLFNAINCTISATGSITGTVKSQYRVQLGETITWTATANSGYVMETESSGSIIVDTHLINIVATAVAE